MPLTEYFGGEGDTVMSKMTKRYGAKKGKQVFYATANARNQTPESNAPKGAPVTPDKNWGDVGAWRQKESSKLGGFKDGACVECPM